MKIVITGATGNAGTSTIEALREDAQVEQIVGVARRRPEWDPPRTTWVEADILNPDLAELIAGADVLIHLAWAIQPSHDLETLRRINVEGSRRVFNAVAEAGIPRLVYASSVGAYAPGPKQSEVDESWPIGATRSSFYSRHKVEVEEILDHFEAEHSEIAVVRLRPALLFKDEAAEGIRRLFAGPFLPEFILRSELIPILPHIGGLTFQAVHSEDIGQAYRLAATGEATGAFNVAAEPALDSTSLAEVFAARTFPLPAPVLRAAANLSWHMHLQPTPPGWLDMALNVPMMSSARIREELGWDPRFSAEEALRELVEGMREGRGFPTPHLDASGLVDRVKEVATGVGSRQWPRSREDQLTAYIRDAHAIEEQALVQMRAAPEIAGEPELAAIFTEHLTETESHERRVRELLESRGESTSAIKDLAGRGGGYGMVLFAELQPDSPGKLVAHALAYENMELAAYELLRRLAERAGDSETAALAGQIGAEERQMAERLEARFDRAVEASLADADEERLDQQLIAYLTDVHAIENQALQLLEAGPGLVESEELAGVFREHLEETRAQADRVVQRLKARGAEPSRLKDAALRFGGLNTGAFFGTQPDTTLKLAGFAFAFEHLEIAAYELLRRVAERAGDPETAAVAEQNLAEERQAAARIAAAWDSPGILPE